MEEMNNKMIQKQQMISVVFPRFGHKKILVRLYGEYVFPRLTALFALFQSTQEESKERESKEKTMWENVEKVTWTDWEGRERDIKIHREVK